MLKTAPLASLAVLAVGVPLAAACTDSQDPVARAHPAGSIAPAKLSIDACESLLGSAQSEIDHARSVAITTCKEDSDCVAISSRACLSDCASDAVAKSDPHYDSAFRTVTNVKCKAWYDGQCNATTPKPSPTCPIYVPTCKSGACATRVGP